MHVLCTHKAGSEAWTQRALKRKGDGKRMETKLMAWRISAVQIASLSALNITYSTSSSLYLREFYAQLYLIKGSRVFSHCSFIMWAKRLKYPWKRYIQKASPHHKRLLMILIKKNQITPKPKHTPIEQSDFSEGKPHTPHQISDKIQHIVLDPIVCGGKNQVSEHNLVRLILAFFPFIVFHQLTELLESSKA